MKAPKRIREVKVRETIKILIKIKNDKSISRRTGSQVNVTATTLKRNLMTNNKITKPSIKSTIFRIGIIIRKCFSC